MPISMNVPCVMVSSLPVGTLGKRVLTERFGESFDPETTSVAELLRIPGLGIRGVRWITEDLYDQCGYRFKPR